MQYSSDPRLNDPPPPRLIIVCANHNIGPGRCILLIIFQFNPIRRKRTVCNRVSRIVNSGSAALIVTVYLGKSDMAPC